MIVTVTPRDPTVQGTCRPEPGPNPLRGPDMCALRLRPNELARSLSQEIARLQHGDIARLRPREFARSLSHEIERLQSAARRRARNASLGEIGVAAGAVGALALGAFAIGALAIGAFAIGRLSVRKARFRSLEIDELTVRRLRFPDTRPARRIKDGVAQRAGAERRKPATQRSEAIGRLTGLFAPPFSFPCPGRASGSVISPGSRPAHPARPYRRRAAAWSAGRY